MLTRTRPVTVAALSVILSTAKNPAAIKRTKTDVVRSFGVMGKTALLLLTLTLAFALATPTLAFADANTTIAGLTNAGQQLEGQTVIFDGEVVGDIINAENGFKWLLVQDGQASISVLVSSSDAERITHLGRYNQTGTLIEVQGRFETDCAEHDGLTDVHATKISIISAGETHEGAFNPRELQIGALLIIIGACLYILHWRLRERTR
jgi:hypothetical protein